MLTKDEIAQAIRGPIKLVDVPEWGGEVGIRRISAADLMRLREFIKPEAERTPATDLDGTVEFLAMLLCDADGNRLFDPDELRECDATQLQNLVAQGQAYNGLGEGAAEEREKNSASGQTSEST